MKPLLLGLCLLMIVSCSKEDDHSEQLSLIGNWGLAYFCWHTNNCLLSENFNPNRANTVISIMSDSTFAGKISKLKVKGSFKETIDESEKINRGGVFKVQALEILNKPSQSQEDTDFINNFETSDLYYINHYGSKSIALSLCNETGCLFFLKSK